MKLKSASLSVIAVAASVILCTDALPKPRGRILVLGFESSQLNDIQDRLLRETVMRRLHTDGFRIVPVMEIESVFNNKKRKGSIRKIVRGDLRKVCDDFAAEAALFGSIRPEDGRRDEVIIPGKTYICTITLYRTSADDFREVRFVLPAENNLYTFYNLLSATILSRIDGLL